MLPTQTQSSPSLGTRDRGGKGSKEELISPRVDRRSTLWQRTLFDYLLVLSIIVSSSRLIVALLYIAAPKPTTPLTLSIDTFPVHHYDALPIPPARPPQVHIVIACNCIMPFVPSKNQVRTVAGVRNAHRVTHGLTFLPEDV